MATIDLKALRFPFKDPKFIFFTDFDGTITLKDSNDFMASPSFFTQENSRTDLYAIDRHHRLRRREAQARQQGCPREQEDLQVIHNHRHRNQQYSQPPTPNNPCLIPIPEIPSAK